LITRAGPNPLLLSSGDEAPPQAVLEGTAAVLRLEPKLKKLLQSLSVSFL
jgi:hypothetical protein